MMNSHFKFRVHQLGWVLVLLNRGSWDVDLCACDYVCFQDVI